MMYPVIYVKSLSGNAVAMSKGPVIWMLESMRGNNAVLQHELVHVKQWAAWCGVGVALAGILFAIGLTEYMQWCIPFLAAHSLLYTLSKDYKLMAEVEAYRVQIEYGGDVWSCAQSLSKDYGLDLTQDQALALLKG